MNDYNDFQNSSIGRFFMGLYTITFGSIYFVLCNALIIIALYALKIDIRNIIAFYIALIPTGPALAALISVINKFNENYEMSITKDFFKYYIKNFKSSIKIWSILLTLCTILIFDLSICFQNNKFPILIIPMIIMLLLIILLILNSIPILCRYEIDTWNNLKLSFYLIFRKPFNSAVNIVILLAWLNLLDFNNFIIKLLVSGIAVFLIMKFYEKTYKIIDNEYLDNLYSEDKLTL